MAKHTEPGHYDHTWNQPALWRDTPAKHLPWCMDRWTWVAEQIQGDAPCVLDLGCGPGQFAEALKTLLGEHTYVGVDFSPRALGWARRRMPSVTWVEADLRPNGAITDLIAMHKPTVVTALETLEHFDRATERAVIEACADAGVPLVVTVPTVDDPGHFRYFPTSSAAKQYYGVKRVAQLPPEDPKWWGFVLPDDKAPSPG